MKRVLLYPWFVFIIAVPTGTAQWDYTITSKRAISFYEQARQHHGLMEFQKSIEALGKAIKIEPEFVEAYLLMAESFKGSKNYDRAISAYRSAIEINPTFFPPAYLNLAVLELKNGEYAGAKEHAEKYLGTGSYNRRTRDMAQGVLQNAEFGLQALEAPVPFDPVNLGDSINSERDEYWPSLSLDESILVFTVMLPIDPDDPQVYRNRHEDFFYSRKINDHWSKAKNAGAPLNTLDNEGAQCISSDGKYLFFTACNRENGMGMCDIYYTRRLEKGWSQPVNLGPPVNSRFSEKHPSISSDGRTLYFASNRPGGKGGLDLWYSTLKEDGTWSEPVNLGDSINTPAHEQSPFIHTDDRTLYFSSNGWPGMGEFDLFYTRGTDSAWSKAINLGYPINTRNQEEGLIVSRDGKTAYFSSNRLSGKGKDIYKFKLYEEARPDLVSYLKGKVYDEKTGELLPASCELINIRTGKVKFHEQASPQGDFMVVLPANDNYALNVSHPGYLFYSDHFSIERVYTHEEPFLMDIPLQPIEIGERIILRNVFYEFDSYTLKEVSRVELDRVVRFMDEHPSLVAEIGGHTDSRGTEAYNLELSEKRSESVVNYLINNGIEPDRIRSKGYGEFSPVASNETKEGRALNRRTELKILAK